MGSSSAFMPTGTLQIPRRPEHWKGEFPPPVSSSNAFKRNSGLNTIGRGKRWSKWRLGSIGLTTDVKNHLGFEDHRIRTWTHWGLLVLSGNIGSLFFNPQDLTYGKWRCNSSVRGDCIIHNPKKGMVVLKNPHPPPWSVRCKWGSGLLKSRLYFLTSKKHKQDYKQRGTTTWGWGAITTVTSVAIILLRTSLAS